MDASVHPLRSVSNACAEARSSYVTAQQMYIVHVQSTFTGLSQFIENRSYPLHWAPVTRLAAHTFTGNFTDIRPLMTLPGDRV